MKAFQKAGIATALCMALSAPAWAHSTNGNSGGNGNGNGGSGNSVTNLISMPQIAPLLFDRGSRSQLTPVVSQKLPFNSIGDSPGNRLGTLKTPDVKNDKLSDDTRKAVLTKVSEKSDQVSKEKDSETMVAAGTSDDSSGSRTQETYQPACR
jgi:hypothetical protein